MRILFIQIENAGGIQLYTSRLVNALAKTQDVHFLLGDRLMNQEYYSQDIKLHFIYSPLSFIKMFFLSLNPLTYHKIIKIIKKVNPDIIHVANPFLWSSIALLFSKKYPIVVTEHDPVPHSGTPFIVSLYTRLSTWLLRKKMAAAIVHGENLKRVMVNIGVKAEKIHVIPHGEYSFYVKWAKKGIREEKSILFFGFIRDYKGLEYLIKAAPVIVSHVPDVRITIAGNGDFSKYAPLIAGKEYFEIHNRLIPDDEVAHFFQKASVVVLPYIDGSQSGIVPVAYSFGKPVVVTNVGSIPESVEDGHTGLIVSPKDPEALANAIIRLLEDDDLRKYMGNNALKKVQTDLSWDNIAQKTIEVYRKAVFYHKNNCSNAN